MVTSLLDLAYLALASGRAEEGARLLAAGDRLRSEAGMALPQSGQREFDESVRTARDALGESFERAWALGRAMSVEAATALALGGPETPPVG